MLQVKNRMISLCYKSRIVNVRHISTRKANNMLKSLRVDDNAEIYKTIALL